MSAQLVVRDAIVAQLLATPAIAGGYVKANRRRPVPDGVADAVFVYLEKSTPTPAAYGFDTRIDWSTQIRVECVSRKVAAVDADDRADTLAGQVYARLMANATLSGALIDPLEQAGMAWAEDEVDGQLSGVQLIFTAAHRTANNTLASAN